MMMMMMVVVMNIFPAGMMSIDSYHIIYYNAVCSMLLKRINNILHYSYLYYYYYYYYCMLCMCGCDFTTVGVLV